MWGHYMLASSSNLMLFEDVELMWAWEILNMF